MASFCLLQNEVSASVFVSIADILLISFDSLLLLVFVKSCLLYNTYDFVYLSDLKSLKSLLTLQCLQFTRYRDKCKLRIQEGGPTQE